jgi:glutaconyl-CoA/methylmalonyl-CoA decarboxylase subunit delta
MENLGFGLWMTAMGMGTVFALLLLLMLVLRAIGWVDKRAAVRNAAPVMPSFDLEEEPKASPDGLTPDEIAAITIAVITHARVRRGQAAPAMRQVQPGSQLFASRWVAIGRSYQNQPWKTR